MSDARSAWPRHGLGCMGVDSPVANLTSGQVRCGGGAHWRTGKWRGAVCFTGRFAVLVSVRALSGTTVTGSAHLGAAVVSKGLYGDAVTMPEFLTSCSSRSRLRALTLDVGHTLLFPEPSVGHIYADVAARHGVQIAPDDAGTRFAECWQQTRSDHTGLIYGTSHQEALDFWLRVVDACFAGCAIGAETVLKIRDDLYWVFARAYVWRLHESFDALLEACARLGVRVAFLSNWDLRLRDLLEDMGLATRVDVVVISAEHGLEKPDPRIFEKALAELGAASADAMHVGDTWGDDIAAAAAVGMRAAWFNPDDDPLPDRLEGVHVIRDLADLIPLLENA
mgnify:FL=1